MLWCLIFLLTIDWKKYDSIIIIFCQDTIESLRNHAKYQRKMFDQAVQLARPGGIIVYSTLVYNYTCIVLFIILLMDRILKWIFCLTMITITGVIFLILFSFHFYLSFISLFSCFIFSLLSINNILKERYASLSLSLSLFLLFTGFRCWLLSTGWYGAVIH